MKLSQLLKTRRAIAMAQRELKKISKKLNINKKIVSLIILMPIIALNFPYIAHAQSIVVVEADQTKLQNFTGFPERAARDPRAVHYVTVTGYNSLPGQTDDNPCVSASGKDLCQHNQENVIAINGLPFGTLVRFPDLFGDKTFEVVDRTNARFGQKKRADLWFQDYEDAIQFGIKRNIKMEVL